MKLSRLTFAIAALALVGFLGLAGCHMPSMDDDQPDDFTQRTLEKHHENGDINDYQYQQSMNQMQAPDPAAQSATGTSGNSTSTPPAKSP